MLKETINIKFKFVGNLIENIKSLFCACKNFTLKDKGTESYYDTVKRVSVNIDTQSLECVNCKKICIITSTKEI